MKRVLIVDDEPSILLSLSHLLSNNEVTVISCSKIEDAEEALERYAFDLVIADVRLSGIYGIEGIELLSYIKRVRPETPVIIMTAYGSDAMRDSAYKKGAFQYYEKPIDMNDLVKNARECGIPISLARNS